MRRRDYKIAVVPKRCHYCGRRIWFQSFRYVSRMIKGRRVPARFPICNKCLEKIETK